MYIATSSEPGKRAALAVLSCLGFWESLPYLLRALAANNEALRPQIQLYVTRWLARRVRIFVPPSASLAAELPALIRESKLPEQILRELAACTTA